MILERVHSPEDLRALDGEQLPQLCRELRQFLLRSVSRTGGHLASNLGAVELTVAIHRIFDTGRDRLVFDVGHQCYAHKALTGRQASFETLRQSGGLSGFPKPRESVHDAFIAGHASNSVSVALGMARARTLLGQDHQVLALLGDGALTGGLAYEGLNNAGSSGEHLVVILNDNGMSIQPNVGAIQGHLSRLRSRPGYYHFKKWYRGLFGTQPMGSPLYRFNHRLKTGLKGSLWPVSTLFEDMGFTYLGPVDGHDLPRLCSALSWAKSLSGPVLLHVHTQKGKGYPPAEAAPGRYHGVPPFDPAAGLPEGEEQESFSSVFGKALTHLAREDGRICAITAAMEEGTGLSAFARAFPERFFDVGIAEGHAVSMAAGMAKQGLIPVFGVYSTFLQRGYDMLLHDVAIQGLHVVLGVDRTGLVGADGETHHGCLDVSYLTAIPGFTVLCPSNFAELRTMLRRALLEYTGPVALRYPRGGEGALRADTGPASAVLLRPGKRAAIVTYGPLINEALAAAQILEGQGIGTGVLKLNCIAPLDTQAILKEMAGKAVVLVLEECFETGSVGQQIAAAAAQAGQGGIRMILQDLKGIFVPEGTVEQLHRRCRLDARAVAEAVKEAMGHGE